MITLLKNYPIQYCAFLDEPLYFNLISTDKGENNWMCLSTEAIMLVMINKSGFLREIEIIPAATRPYLDTIYNQENIISIEGLPCFDIETLTATFTIQPIIFIEEISKKVLLLFNERKNDINTAYVYQNLKFLCADDELVALEIEQVVRDNDNKQQSVWEDAHGLCKDEDDNT